jgi:hypothetical protein
VSIGGSFSKAVDCSSRDVARSAKAAQPIPPASPATVIPTARAERSVRTGRLVTGARFRGTGSPYPRTGTSRMTSVRAVRLNVSASERTRRCGPIRIPTGAIE